VPTTDAMTPEKHEQERARPASGSAHTAHGDFDRGKSRAATGIVGVRTLKGCRQERQVWSCPEHCQSSIRSLIARNWSATAVNALTISGSNWLPAFFTMRAQLSGCGTADL
jgi:hypothetical protein